MRNLKIYIIAPTNYSLFIREELLYVKLIILENKTTHGNFDLFCDMLYRLNSKIKQYTKKFAKLAIFSQNFTLLKELKLGFFRLKKKKATLLILRQL